MKKVIFVCLGNICRSPAAEAVMKERLKERGLEEKIQVDSAGTYGGHNGSLPDARMRAHAERRGYTLDSRARKFYPEADFADADMIIGMDEQNIADLRWMAKDETERSKIFKMTDFCNKLRHHTTVPDPYYGGEAGFELVLDILEDAVDGIIEQLEEKLKQ